MRTFVEIKNPAASYFPMTLAIIVSSALKGLTSVFGMGTGVSPSVSPPETYASITLA